MIVIAGSIDVDPDRREAALEAGRPHVLATRAWPGCRAYVWSADSLEEGRIQVFEEWESEEALAAHFAGPHYRAMRDTIAAHGIRGIEVCKYRVALREPVYDERGRPRADFLTGRG